MESIEAINKYLLSKRTVGRPRVFDAAAILGHLETMCRTSQSWRQLTGGHGKYETLHRNFMEHACVCARESAHLHHAPQREETCMPKLVCIVNCLDPIGRGAHSIRQRR